MRLLRALCVAAIVLSSIDLMISAFGFDIPQSFSPDLAMHVMNAYGYLRYAVWALLLLVFVALLWLTYRLAWNLHALKSPTFSMSPTYAIALYLVPIANLFMPPRIVDAISRATHTAAGADISRPTFAGWWWTAWIATAVLSNTAAVVAAKSGAFDPEASFDVASYQVSLWMDLGAGALSLVALWLTFRLFAPIARMQSDLIQRRAAQPV